MKPWALGIVAVLVMLVGLPALTLALADDPVPAAAATGPGPGPQGDNPGHHYGWTKDNGKPKDEADEADDADHTDQADHRAEGMGHGWGKQMQRAEEWCRTGKIPGPPPWAHGSVKPDKGQKDVVRGFCRHVRQRLDGLQSGPEG